MSVPGTAVPPTPADAIAPTPTAPDIAAPPAPTNIPLVARLIERYRLVLFAFCAIVIVVSFNGQWRIGLDSALYRGLADALATGRGYQFGEFATNTIYPGLPVLLAAIQKSIGKNVFGPWPSVLMIVGFAVVSLVVTYRLFRLHYPAWVATTITCGVALNARFLQLSNELLTDIPFFCGLVTSLLGWDLLRLARTRGATIRAVAIAAGGLLLAASMRPTFWILAVCWIGAAGFKLVRHRHRWAAMALGVILVVIAFVITVDPRTRGWRIFEGGYEQEFLGMLIDAGASHDTRAPGVIAKLQNNVPRLLGENFPELFLGTEFPFGGNYFISAVLLISSIGLIRRHPLWGWLVIATVGITLMLSTTPRYYLMVLPFLLLGWLKYCEWLRFGSVRWWGNLVLLYGLGFVTFMNLAKATPFIVEQRRTPFQQHYKNGDYLPAVAMAEQIRQVVPRKEKVIGPYASVLSFLSGRQVMMQRELLPPKKGPRQYADLLAHQKLPWGVFPAGPYKEVDPDIARMIERRVIRPIEVVATVQPGNWQLAKIAIVPPAPGIDWRDLPLAREVTAAKNAKKLAAERKAARERRELAARKAERQRKLELAERRAAADRKLAAERKAAADRKAAKERKLKKQRQEEERRRRAATQPSSAVPTDFPPSGRNDHRGTFPGARQTHQARTG